MQEANTETYINPNEKDVVEKLVITNSGALDMWQDKTVALADMKIEFRDLEKVGSMDVDVQISELLGLFHRKGLLVADYAGGRAISVENVNVEYVLDILETRGCLTTSEIIAEVAFNSEKQKDDIITNVQRENEKRKTEDSSKGLSF